MLSILIFLITPLRLTPYVPLKPLPPPPVAVKAPALYPVPAFVVSISYISEDVASFISPFTSTKSTVSLGITFENSNELRYSGYSL